MVLEILKGLGTTLGLGFAVGYIVSDFRNKNENEDLRLVFNIIWKHQLKNFVYRRKMNKKPYTEYEMPEYLKEHMKKIDSINIQVIGSRGKGKSTMVRHLLELQNRADSANASLPKTGSTETTREPTAYEYTKGVYLWDMPGLGGKVISITL